MGTSSRRGGMAAQIDPEIEIMNDRQKIHVDVVSDVMCPWCYIGKINLDSAIKTADELDIEIKWRPYQLDSTLPKEGRDRQEYLNAKFGGKEGAQDVYGRIEEAGKALGIDFNFKDMKVSPNTLDAHRLIFWAGGQSPEMQDRIVTRLFELFFLEGAHIGEDDVLIEAAKDAGMDDDHVRELLASDADREQVSGEVDEARNKGISGVPFFIINNKYAVSGAQPPASLVQTFRHAAAEKAEENQYLQS